jgi:hypothetical protein
MQKLVTFRLSVSMHVEISQRVHFYNFSCEEFFSINVQGPRFELGPLKRFPKYLMLVYLSESEEAEI